MLKFIDTRRVGKGINKKLIVKTFPGAKIDDMINYITPTLNKHPKEVIVQWELMTSRLNHLRKL